MAGLQFRSVSPDYRSWTAPVSARQRHTPWVTIVRVRQNHPRCVRDQRDLPAHGRDMSERWVQSSCVCFRGSGKIGGLQTYVCLRRQQRPMSTGDWFTQRGCLCCSGELNDLSMNSHHELIHLKKKKTWPTVLQHCPNAVDTFLTNNVLLGALCLGTQNVL